MTNRSDHRITGQDALSCECYLTRGYSGMASSGGPLHAFNNSPHRSPSTRSHEGDPRLVLNTAISTDSTTRPIVQQCSPIDLQPRRQKFMWGSFRDARNTRQRDASRHPRILARRAPSLAYASKTRIIQAST